MDVLSRRAFLGGGAAGLAVPLSAHAANESEADLIDRAMDGINPDTFVDVHNHVVGMGHGNTGCAVHPDMSDAMGHPLNWIRFRSYARASGVRNMDQVDQEFMAVLKQRVEAMPHRGKALLMAFDQVYGEDGQARPEDTIFHVPNDYMFKTTTLSDRFAGCASVHPYRNDAVEALHRVADQGAVAIKWLPNAMWIDPANPMCDAAYEVMAKRKLTLISHGGEEQAVPSEHTQEFGNPLRLRRALEAGVTVVVAHCASHGNAMDLDHPTQRPTPAFDLFLRLMDDPRWEGQLYGEISAILLLNRVRGVADTLLRRRDLHHRLVHGSDYPIPGVDPLINLFQLWSLGLIQWKDRAGLSSLFGQNPLLGDFVLKRVLTVDGGPPTGFPPSVFGPDPSVFPLLKRPETDPAG
jgi:predicted TIM-barrel fold metal-dependent hydrolase